MRIVQCHGCFDLLHLGHIRHLQAAAAAGDYLIVTVTPDRFVNKGPGRPVFTDEQRAAAVAALGCVDEVHITDSPTAADAIRRIKPAVFAKGPDYSAETLDAGEAAALAKVGGTLLITQTEKWSSTALLQRETHSPEIEAYLQTIRAKYSSADVLSWLEKARTLKTLVIGDAITDEYVYCQTLGKSGKEPILAAQYLRTETFIGGVHAVAKHVEACCDAVQVVTGLPTIKRRFIETYPFQKLFEVYEVPEAAAAKRAVDIQEGKWIGSVDLMVAADYGHGFMPLGIPKGPRFLAVNVQANAGNHGFNTISKYPRADFISLSERELRLDARDQHSPIQDLIRACAEAKRATVLITRGAHGCLAYDAEDGFSDAPGLISHTVDRMGAGDAVFAITACCAAVGMPLDLLTFVAAVVGTMAVGIVGNARYIERATLHEAIQTWLR